MQRDSARKNRQKLKGGWPAVLNDVNAFDEGWLIKSRSVEFDPNYAR